MDTNKNSYTVIYATVLVVLVAVVLALASYLLKDRQQRNVEIETKQMILKSVKLGLDANNHVHGLDDQINPSIAEVGI